jgi:phi LC3 family holin
MINWKVRLKNKAFWLAIIPAVLLLVQQLCALFGIELNMAGVSEQLTAIVGTVFAVLSLVGIVNDPTTSGLSDSERAMTYQEPK